MSDAAPVLVLNSPPVKPEVIVDVAADAAGPADAKLSGDLTPNATGDSKQLSLKDLGVAPPPAVRRAEGSDLKETFERAAGEIMYRLDSLTKLSGGRRPSAPVVVTINL